MKDDSNRKDAYHFVLEDKQMKTQVLEKDGKNSSCWRGMITERFKP